MRLASVPNMFGDFFNAGGQVQVSGAFSAMADFPTAGGAGRLKVAENNKAVTMDRVYFMAHHFHHALAADSDVLDGIAATRLSVDRYTIGMERSFLDHAWSVDVRLPLVERYRFDVPKFGVRGGRIGNLAVTLKRQLVATCDTALAAGLGVDLPTASASRGHAGSTQFTLHNDAVHLGPFFGFLRVPGGDRFYQGFLQLDLPLNGNRTDFTDPFLGVSGRFGDLTEQTLLHLDLSVGRWVYRNRSATLLTGLAPLVELHYTTALQDADTVAGTVGPLAFRFGNRLNRVDLLQLTVGLHAELGRTALRVGGVLPLLDDAERPFDAELQVSLNRRF